MLSDWTWFYAKSILLKITILFDQEASPLQWLIAITRWILINSQTIRTLLPLQTLWLKKLSSAHQLKGETHRQGHPASKRKQRNQPKKKKNLNQISRKRKEHFWQLKLKEETKRRLMARSDNSSKLLILEKRYQLNFGWMGKSMILWIQKRRI